MLAKRLGPGGAKAIIAKSVLIKHQQLIVRRSIRKTPRLTTSDRFLCGFLVLFMHPRRIRKAAIVLKPATLTNFRSTLSSRNYHRPMWKPQILDGAIMCPSIVSTSASALAQMRLWLPRLVRTSWHEPAIMFFVTRCRSILSERLARKEIRFWLGL